MQTGAGLITIVLLAMTLTVGAGAAEYFLAPDGDDQGPGTREAPWRTLEKASAAAEAGDTVTLLPGRYAGVLRPLNSGTAGAPIVFRAEPRRQALLTGAGEDEFAILLFNVSHVRLEGLQVSPDPADGRWFTALLSSHVTVDDCLMEGGQGGAPLVIDRCDQVKVRMSRFGPYEGGNMFLVAYSTHVLIEGNSVSRAGHCPIQFYTDAASTAQPNTNVVIRGNVFHAGWGRHLEHYNTTNMLFEGNIVTNAVNSGRSAGSASQVFCENAIFRFNRLFRNWGGPMLTGPWGGAFGSGLLFRDVRLYNNVVDENAQYGFRLQTTVDGERVRNVVFANNVFSRNDPHGSHRQLTMRMYEVQGDGVRVMNNVLVGDTPGRPVIDDPADMWYSQYPGITLREAQERFPQRYHGNLDVLPGYSAPALYDHSLAPDSGLRDAGAPLARAVGDGEGDVLPVDDVLPFFDGFGIEGEVGDMIAVGRPDHRARVVSKDYEARALTLDRSVVWRDGDPVSLPWAGEGPDIGAYEHGAAGRGSVQVVVEPFEAAPGQAVALRAVLHGDLKSESVRWWLGDGTMAEGAELTHTYAAASDYPVRVVVTDSEGGRHVAAGYVWVYHQRGEDEPLLHSTFDRDDTTWWLDWQTYRPAPAAYERLLDEDDGRGRLRVYAPEDGGFLPCYTAPRTWDIDRDWRIRIRYRVGEGTPVALYLHAFEVPEEVNRRVCLAASPAAEPPAEEIVADHVLIADGQWTELEIDARLIRQRYPEVTRIEALRFHGTPRESVKAGDWYELDEVIIGGSGPLPPTP